MSEQETEDEPSFTPTFGDFLQVDNVERKEKHTGKWEKGNMRIYKQPAPATSYVITFAKEGKHQLDDEYVKDTHYTLQKPGYQLPDTVKKCRTKFTMTPKKGRVNFVNYYNEEANDPEKPKIKYEINVKDSGQLSKLLEGLKKFGWKEDGACHQAGGRTRKRKYRRKKTRKNKRKRRRRRRTRRAGNFGNPNWRVGSSGNKGLIGLSISLEVKVSCSVGRASLLK